MSKVIFIMGMSGIGKTTYRKKHLNNIKTLDLLDVQKKVFGDVFHINYDLVWQSYVELKEEILKCVDRGEDIVVEHTLLKAMRRELYIEDLKKRDVEIIGYFINVDKETYLKHGGKEWEFNRSLEIVEIPTLSEGFDELHILYNGKEVNNL